MYVVKVIIIPGTRMLSSTKIVMLEPSRLALLMDLLATSVQNMSPSLRKREREREYKMGVKFYLAMWFDLKTHKKICFDPCGIAEALTHKLCFDLKKLSTTRNSTVSHT